ncbi:UDP-glucose--hexose-1-phosphate uridylyltransferase [Heyndrickxia acidicola]|uniref:Galactose-1-phosphate uridylyltransferase n=1 Tax=Heyndrickxia acidicola TaxID=209389 RepID=A0ABU6MG70_9BACI|nr:UDP-glucose--hexose-1-phosphate uridylyltransferase [Heyndrickxia acidicola]MED1203377.1 UDP-glucose--hexose-1-phosphate uridylyltransferase [Heyndrickxia acidicola]
MSVNEAIQELINHALSAGLIEKEDQIYARNQILALLELEEFPEAIEADLQNEVHELLDFLTSYAAGKGLIEDLFDEKEILSSKIMSCFVARPSVINQAFYQKYQDSPETATRYFYQLSQNSQYIQMHRIRKNIEYKAPTEYGDLDITINLSKPEKDPKAIAREKAAPKKSGYPKCLLCIENEGYEGRIGHPARSSHRMIRVYLQGQNWYLQYSPYIYYNEHCIVLCEQHTDMKISPDTFSRLLSFVKQFPHYFLGSNADLPIVGGSILSHDHYQGGHYEFAMAKAEDDWTFTMKNYPDIHCSVVKWPMSVIRLRSKNPDELTEASADILAEWRGYSDPTAGILAESEGNPHNTITPIARFSNGHFEMDLVLRNNRTSEEHPLGIFHPHADVHHIKKENIGLIEVMGLAVLPARLREELEEVRKFVLDEENDIKAYHQPWAESIKKIYENQLSSETAEGIIRTEVGRKFLRVLEDAGVYKRNEEGKLAFKRFIQQFA